MPAGLRASHWTVRTAALWVLVLLAWPSRVTAQEHARGGASIVASPARGSLEVQLDTAFVSRRSNDRRITTLSPRLSLAWIFSGRAALSVDMPFVSANDGAGDGMQTAAGNPTLMLHLGHALARNFPVGVGVVLPSAAHALYAPAAELRGYRAAWGFLGRGLALLLPLRLREQVGIAHFDVGMTLAACLWKDQPGFPRAAAFLHVDTEIEVSRVTRVGLRMHAYFDGDMAPSLEPTLGFVWGRYALRGILTVGESRLERGWTLLGMRVVVTAAAFPAQETTEPTLPVDDPRSLRGSLPNGRGVPTER